MRTVTYKKTKSIPLYHGHKGDYHKKGRPEYISWAMELTEWMEGRRNKTFWDGENPPVVGIGFYLDRKKNKRILQKLGIDYYTLLSGAEILNGYLIEKMLEESTTSAAATAAKWVRNFHKLNDARKAAITYMLLITEPTKMNKIADEIEKENFEQASKALKKTPFYKKYPQKANTIAKILEEGEIKEIEECPIFS